MSPSKAELLRRMVMIREVAAKRGIELPDIEAEARAASLAQVREQYQDDPAGFCEVVLGEQLTDGIQEMLESVRDNRVTIAKSANAVGKTWGAGRVAAWFFAMWDTAQVHTTAAPPEKNLRRLLWGEIDAVVEKHAWLFADSKLQVTHIYREKKELRSWITGHSIPQSGTEEQREAKFAGKHAPHMLWIVDEGDAVPDEVYRGIESCMSGEHDRLLIMLNPRAEIGAAHTMIKDGKANVIKMSAFDHPNVRTGRNVIPGAVSQETVVRRINEWSRPLHDDERPTDECFEVPEFLVGAIAERPEGGDYAPLASGWREVTETSLWYMVLAEYPAQSEFQLVSRAWVNAARARWDVYVSLHGKKPPKQTKAVMGIDVAEFGGDENVVCLRYGGWVAPMRTWRGVDVEASADEAIAIYTSEDVERACVDAIGIGSAVAPKMRRNECRGAQAVKVSEKPTKRLERDTFSILRDQLGWDVARWLEKDPGAMLPPDEELVEELLVQRYSKQSGRIRVSKKKTVREKLPRKRSPNRWDALCLTFAPARKVLIDFV